MVERKELVRCGKSTLDRHLLLFIGYRTQGTCE